MATTNYTELEIKDIKERVSKAAEYLKSVNLSLSAVVQKVKIGREETNGQEGDVFGDKVIPYLQDTKYQKEEKEIESPYKNKNVI